MIYDRTGDFYWLFMTMAIITAIVAGAACFLPSRGRRIIAAAAPAE
jgi:hypothetical protein